jgi:hypothetical protein
MLQPLGGLLRLLLGAGCRMRRGVPRAATRAPELALPGAYLAHLLPA